jgi:hypothetical protein
MTPTLLGRLQTRVFAVAIIGSLWTLVISPVLPGGGALTDRYRVTFAVLTMVLVLGLAWEFVYHFLQQFRWEKDWVELFGLVTLINEGIAVWLIVSAGIAPGSPTVSGWAFVTHFVTTWLVLWVWIFGPMRVPFLRWRFRGGRLL